MRFGMWWSILDGPTSNAILQSAPLVAYREVMVGLAGVPTTTFEDVRLARHTLLMAMHDNGAEGCQASRAALPVGIRRNDGVVHIACLQCRLA